MFRWLHKGRQLVGVATLFATLVTFIGSNQFAVLRLALDYADPFSLSEYRLRRLSTEAYEASIEEALAEGDIEDAQSLVEIALENGHVLRSDLIERTEENSLEFGWRHAQGFLQGALTGEIATISSAGGVLAADYAGVGDLRDIVVQGNYYLKGEEYDAVTLGFALVGLTTSATIWAASAGTVATAGAGVVVAGPAMAVASTVDSGAAIIKNAHKMRKLSPPLLSSISEISARTIDMQALKKGLSHISLPSFEIPSATKIRSSVRGIKWEEVMMGNFSSARKLMTDLMPIDLASANTALAGAIRKDALNDAKALATSVSTLGSYGGLKTAFRAMEHAENARDLSRFQALSVKMGKKSAAVIKILGKGAIKLGKLAYQIVAVLFAALSWLIGALWLSYSLILSARRFVKRVKIAAV